MKCYTEDVTERSILAILANGEISSPAHVLSVPADRIVGRLSAGSALLRTTRRRQLTEVARGYNLFTHAKSCLQTVGVARAS